MGNSSYFVFSVAITKYLLVKLGEFV